MTTKRRIVQCPLYSNMRVNEGTDQISSFSLLTLCEKLRPSHFFSIFRKISAPLIFFFYRIWIYHNTRRTARVSLLHTSLNLYFIIGGSGLTATLSRLFWVVKFFLIRDTHRWNMLRLHVIVNHSISLLVSTSMVTCKLPSYVKTTHSVC